MTAIQLLLIILGTLAGSLFVAFVLIPVYFRLQLVSIYGYLKVRFGPTTYKTGSMIFLISQSFGAALRLLLSIKILQYAFFQSLHIPYWLTIAVVLVLIWLYTHKSGIRTIVWTDALQSAFLITVIVISNFVKQFVSGFLITVALVGLDQSMMQKTLTVGNARDARKNVLGFSLFIAVAQTLFLGMGVLMYLFARSKGIPLAVSGGKFQDTDGLYPLLTLHYFGATGAIAFLIAVIASTFASIDACITALTTAFSYDFLQFESIPHERKARTKNQVLLGVNFWLYL